MLKDKAHNLAIRAINKPTLLNTLTQDKYETFVLGVAMYYRDLAIKLDEIKPIVDPSKRIDFWKSVGILMNDEDYS
jgi:hypothetical protein